MPEETEEERKRKKYGMRVMETLINPDLAIKICK